MWVSTARHENEERGNNVAILVNPVLLKSCASSTYIAAVDSFTIYYNLVSYTTFSFLLNITISIDSHLSFGFSIINYVFLKLLILCMK